MEKLEQVTNECVHNEESKTNSEGKKKEQKEIDVMPDKNEKNKNKSTIDIKDTNSTKDNVDVLSVITEDNVRKEEMDNE